MIHKINFEKLFSEVYEDTGIKINSIADIKKILLESEKTELRSSMAYFIAEYKIIELQQDVVDILCSPISKGNDCTLIYASYQFPCSQYFKIYVGLMIERDFHSVLESYKAIRKCRNISIEDLEKAKESLESWHYFYTFPTFSNIKVISDKINLVEDVWYYLKRRLIREKKHPK